MVSGAQGKLTDHRSNMWPVVVLGIITAVLAWVWFGGRAESRGKERTEDTIQERSEDTGLGTHLTSLQEEPESEDPQPQKTPDNGVLSAGQASLSPHTATQLDKELSTIGRDEGYGQGETFLHEDLVQDHKDGCHLTPPHKEGLHISQEPPQQSKTEVHHSTGVEEQVHEDLSPSGATGDELVGAREECHPSVDGQEAQDTVEDLKPAMVTEEKLVQTRKENDLVVPNKVVPIGAKTGLMHPDCDQADGGTLVNGSEGQVQKDNGTGNVIIGNAPTVTTSPRQVNRSASENNFDQYDHSKLESSEQSEMVLAFDKKPLVTLENTACAQVNGEITNHASTENCHAEVVIPQKSEDVILTSQTSPTVDKCVLLQPSNQEEQSPDFKWSSSSENSCFTTHSEAKLHDVDPQRTKRVAAIQPIPQNVSLGFKVHYITHADSQLIAVIGDHETLGEWESYVPLSSDKDGNWSHSVTLPADANVEWKFVMVENGKIKRWEECYNRHLRTAHEDLATQQWWGYP